MLAKYYSIIRNYVLSVSSQRKYNFYHQNTLLNAFLTNSRNVIGRNPSMVIPMGRQTGQNSQLHLCVLNFIYASSTSFMLAQLHLCVLNFIYACSTSFMRPQLHLCLLNFIYASSTSFMLAQLHLCVLNFIYTCSTSFMRPQLHLCLLNFIYTLFFYKEPVYKEPTCRRPKYLKNLYY